MQSVYFNKSDEYNQFPSFVQAVMDHMDFKKWGFEIQIFPSGTLNGFSSAIIFQSESCKIRFWTFRDRPYDPLEIYFTYGKLYAPNEKHVMTWNGRQCHCWHGHLFIYVVLNYLDGLSPQEVAAKEFPYFPDVLARFEKEALDSWSRHEWEARRHNVIWNHYGQRLFDLFDLRMPELWEHYVDFYQEFCSLMTRFEYCYDPNIC
jgi:hypothetical protein